MQLGTDSGAREAFQLLLALGLGAMVGLERRWAILLWCTSAMGVLAAVDRPLLACMIASATLITNITLHYVEHVLVKISADGAEKKL
jgi:uncharacterized membrane protein YhiD involved in acid resistance